MQRSVPRAEITPDQGLMKTELNWRKVNKLSQLQLWQPVLLCLPLRVRVQFKRCAWHPDRRGCNTASTAAIQK
jgi:hypothetical protein